MLARLRHPHIVLFLGASGAPPAPMLVTELLDGGTLFDLLYRRQPPAALSWGRFRELCEQVCLGLNYLHMNTPQIIHRDLKPANCLLDRSEPPTLKARARWRARAARARRRAAPNAPPAPRRPRPPAPPPPPLTLG